MSAAIRAEGGVETLEPALVQRWRELAELRENPFLTPEWHSTWLETHPEDEPFIVLWEEGEELRGVLPLVVARRGPARTLCLAGARRADWMSPACEPADERRMGRDCAELLVRERRSWGLLRLDRVDSESAWPEALWAEGGLAPARPRRRDVMPFAAIGPGGYEEYLATRSRNFRSQLGRRRRKLESEYGLRFRLTEDPTHLEADFEVFLDLHEERWSKRGGSSSGAEDVQRFNRHFAALALDRGWLRLWTAEADGGPAASWYGWRIGDRYCYVLSGLDARFERLSLGTVLIAHTIEQAAAEGATVYDMMWGDEPYKRRFETGRREAATWVLGRRRQPLGIGAAARTSVESVMRRARGG